MSNLEPATEEFNPIVLTVVALFAKVPVKRNTKPFKCKIFPASKFMVVLKKHEFRPNDTD
jgi:hypothetical protein